jgi:hypothetical protein
MSTGGADSALQHKSCPDRHLITGDLAVFGMAMGFEHFTSFRRRNRDTAARCSVDRIREATMSSRPVGSGKFARAAGCIFLAAAAAVFLWDGYGERLGLSVSPIYILVGWLIASGVVAIAWGQNRINTGDKENNTIGMDTINMIVTMLGVTFAVAAFITG